MLKPFFLVFVLLLGIISETQAQILNQNNYYVVPRTYYNQAFPKKTFSLEPGLDHMGLALARLSSSEVTHLSRTIHERYGFCGGFQNLDVLLRSGLQSPEQALQWVASRPRRVARFEPTEPKHPQAVSHVFSKMSIDRIGALIKFLTTFQTRYSKSDDGLRVTKSLYDMSSNLIRQQNRLKAMVTVVATNRSEVKQDSVLVKLVGQDSTLPAVVIGGHMDTVAGNAEGGPIRPGADDDATGTATVMEVLNAVLQSGLKFKRDIYFAFYAAEELGLWGSQRVVQEFRNRKIPVRAVLQLDMTGYKSPKDFQEIFFMMDNVDVNLTEFLRKLATAYLGIPREMMGTFSCGISCSSDQASWHQFGYSAAMPFETSRKNVHPHIHTGKDTMEWLNFAHIAKFAKLGAAFVTELAEPF